MSRNYFVFYGVQLHTFVKILCKVGISFKIVHREWITTPISSDCQCTSGDELISPFLGIYVAVTRKTDADRELGPEQKIGVKEALRAYTINSAYATFEEGVKGSIEPGKLADFVVLSDDPLIVRDNEIKDINVEMTIIGGKIVYKKP